MRDMMRTVILGRCPRCGRHGMFSGFSSVTDVCTGCGVRFDRDDGSVLAAMVLVFASSLMLTLVLAVQVLGRGLFPGRELWILIPFNLIAIAVLYRPAKAAWLWWMHRIGEMKTDAEWRTAMAPPGTSGGSPESGSAE